VKELGTLLPFVLIAAVFWFFLIRPQRRRQLELLSTQRSLEVGDEVMLNAGIVGTVSALPDAGDFIDLEIATGVRLKVARGAVAKILTPDQELPGEAMLDPADPTDDPGQEPPR